uniref:HDC12959 n=1 Tax=Drosophila melanogaster TaxID=7227 RepID=Q6IKB6_DROME|nr:TPA_inf: HDC12959 [Drosophila melanogaster]
MYKTESKIAVCQCNFSVRTRSIFFPGAALKFITHLMHKRPQAGYGNFTHFINTAGGVALPVRDTSGLPIGGNSLKSLRGKHIHVCIALPRLALHFIFPWLHLASVSTSAVATSFAPSSFKSFGALIQLPMFTPSLSVCLMATYGGTYSALLPLRVWLVFLPRH